MTLASILQHTGVRWLLAGGVAAGLGGIFLGELLLPPAHEVLYSGTLSMAYCGPVAAPCSFKYSFSVGNTGKGKQDNVRIELPAELPQASVGIKVSDIVASARKTPQPQVRQEPGEGSTVFIISELAPNTVVDIDLFCALCERAHLDAVRAMRAKVEARGRVSEADPRISTFMNGVINVLRLLGVFR